MSMPEIRTEADFTAFAEELIAHPESRTPLGWGIFRAQLSQSDAGKMLTGTYPALSWKGKNLGSFMLYAYAAGLFEYANFPMWNESELVIDITPDMVQILLKGYAPYLESARGREHVNAQVAKFLPDLPEGDLSLFKLVILFDDKPPQSLPAAYMKLMALSKCFAKPRELNLDGIFALLPNVAWSAGYAFDLDWLRDNEVAYKMLRKLPNIDYVDRYPRYLSHVIPDDDISILPSRSVSLGAYRDEAMDLTDVADLPGIFSRGKWLSPLPDINVH